jgi:hypothetical protein
MKRFTMFACLALALVFATTAVADVMPQKSLGDFDMLYGGVTNFAKASRDTFLMIGPWGSGAPVNGQFEDELGNPSWNGWTHYDVTSPPAHWSVSDYFADNLPGGAGNLAAWCGSLAFPACSATDVDGGYGNSWNDILEWRATVDSGVGTNVHFTAWANIDSEPGYDYTEIVYFGADGRTAVGYYDGTQPGVFMDHSFALSTADYQGDNLDEVIVQVNFISDGAWSDADCLFSGAGALQIDDINVVYNQGGADITSTTDFEGGYDFETGDWKIQAPLGVGDFTQLWSNLEDVDPCASNYSPQVAFIDDGNIVPGVGPSLCIDWCYGPNGYIVNTTGGAAGPDAHLQDALESPIIDWPAADADGSYLTWDCYRHEDLSADSPGIFYTWSIRSTPSANPSDIEAAGWMDRNFVYYGGPDYQRANFVVTDLLEPGRLFTQVQFTAYELGYVWGYIGNDGYPAPYFDNVKYVAYPFYGPGLATREIDIANDNFPAFGEVDLVNLGLNSVRFDMAQNIDAPETGANVPGDSIVIDITPVRAGAAFVGHPQLVWAMQPNHLFDEFRTSEFGTATSGAVDGVEAMNNGQIVPGKYAFDLPDSNFLYPGDILHYYITATDSDGVEEQTATLPAGDLGAAPDGFGDFSRPLAYSSSFTVRALPSVYDDPNNPGTLVTPKTLFWNDFANRGGESEWHGSFANLGLVLGRDYDTFYTNGPSSGVGNGLGGRATSLSIDGYDNMVYTSGNLGTFTISNGDPLNDISNDIFVLDSWMRNAPRDFFATGDDLVSDLAVNAGPNGVAFVQDWLKVTRIDNDLRPLVNNQATPLVKTIAGNNIYGDNDSWIAYGGCFSINTFDAVEADVNNGGVQLAEFADPNGGIDAYSYSAATLYVDADTGSRAITMPYDFMYIYTDPNGAKVNASLPARAVVLEQTLAYFGVEGAIEDVSSVPGADKFAVRNYPNPFNPTTKIEFTMPRAGHLTLKIFNVKGELVKTLIDEQIESSGHIMWDGTNDSGAKVSSGVYFSEARTAGQVQVNKMALVK